MTEAPLTSRQAFWQTHLQRAKAERLSIRAYARREGVSEQSLYAAKRKASTAATAVPAFAAVRLAGMARCELSLPGGVLLRLPELPPAQWLAALAREIGA